MNTSLVLGPIFIALGCLAYMLITGKPPFTAPHIFDVLAAQQNTPFPKLGDKYPLGSQLDPWLVRLTAKAHNRRFQRANEALKRSTKSFLNLTTLRTKRSFSPSKTVTVTQLRLKAKQVETEGTQTFLINTPQAVPADEDSDLTQTIMISPTDISSSGSGNQKGFGAHLIAFEDCSLRVEKLNKKNFGKGRRPALSTTKVIWCPYTRRLGLASRSCANG